MTARTETFLVGAGLLGVTAMLSCTWLVLICTYLDAIELTVMP